MLKHCHLETILERARGGVNIRRGGGTKHDYKGIGMHSE